MSDPQKKLGESSRVGTIQRERHLPPKFRRKPSRATSGHGASPSSSEPARVTKSGPASSVTGSASGSGSSSGSGSGSVRDSVPRLSAPTSISTPATTPTPALTPAPASGTNTPADWTVLSFFTPSAESFRPKPYYPSSKYIPRAFRGDANPKPRDRDHAPTPAGDISSEGGTASGSGAASLPSPKPYDVACDDPGVVFLHPPFDELPDKCLGRVTYALMAANPEWFLDPADFKRVEGLGPECDDDGDGDGEAPALIVNKPNAIAYPTFLEPPRGWCPTRYKHLLEDEREREQEHMFRPSRLSDAPTLRCTFCRRKYAGVNAKSMWRRHVLEKHRIPMQNRREGAEMGRLRMSAYSL